MRSALIVILIFTFSVSAIAQYKPESAKVDSLETKIKTITKRLNDSGSQFEYSFISIVAGITGTLLLALATYDKDKKEFDGIAYIPVAIGTLAGLVFYFNATSNLKNAGND